MKIKAFVMLGMLSWSAFAVGCSAAGEIDGTGPDGFESVVGEAGTSGDAGEKEDIAKNESAVELNECACIDLSQIEDCRSGKCYCFRKSGSVTRTCWVGQNHDHSYRYTCPTYSSYRC